MSQDVHLESRELVVRYGKQRAVDGVSFRVEPSQVYALLGRNGAGKSSLVRCLLGQQRACAGQTLLFGKDAWKHRAEAMLQVGVLPEEPDAPPRMTVKQVLDFCRPLYPTWDEAAVQERVDRFKLPLKGFVGKLSRGQRGQLGLTLALAHRPQLLILDDPTLGLDPVARRSLYEELLGDLADRGTTVFLTTHDLAGIEGIADRVGIMKAGKLLVDEDLESLKTRFRRIRCPEGRLLPAMEPLLKRSTPFGEEWVVGAFDELSCAAAQAQDDRIEIEAMSLEDIFIALADDREDA